LISHVLRIDIERGALCLGYVTGMFVSTYATWFIL
jgi:hypothetical protein